MQKQLEFSRELQQCIELIDSLQQVFDEKFWLNFYDGVTQHQWGSVFQGGILLGLWMDAFELLHRWRTKQASQALMTPLWLAGYTALFFDGYLSANKAYPTTFNQVRALPVMPYHRELLIMHQKLKIDWDISLKDFRSLLIELKNTIDSTRFFLHGCINQTAGATLLFNFFQNGGRDVVQGHILPMLGADRIVNKYRSAAQQNERDAYLKFKDFELSVRPS